jgi:MFS family permease
MTAMAMPRRTRAAIIIALFVVTVFNYMDRSVIAVLLEGIGREFDLTDSQLGLLSGLPFALLYALVGLPFARVADVWNRRLLIALAVAGWSIATAMCGFAMGFWTLFLLRVCVGIGEGAGTPATHSVVAEAFPPQSRAGAAAVISLAASVGGLLGYAGGGALADLYGWRHAFLIVGLPGVLAALLAWWLIPEPRSAPRWPANSELFGGEAIDVLKRLIGLRAYIFLVGGFTTVYFVQMGISQWLAVYLIRDFGLTARDVGVAIGSGSALGAVLGSVAGGVLGNRLAARHISWLLRLPAIAALLMFPFMAGMMISDDLTIVTLLLFGASFLGTLCFGPVFGAMYGLASPAERATMIALTALATNIVGYGLGPLVIGAISDLLQPSVGLASLRYAMLAVTILLIPGGLMFYTGARTLAEDSWREEPAGI